VYVKGSPGGGGAVYIAKCAELGLTPVSQVGRGSGVGVGVGLGWGCWLSVCVVGCVAVI